MQAPSPYQLFILVFSALAIGILGLETLAGLGAPALELLFYADTALCALFFADFVHSVAVAPDRRKYLLTWGWLDLLSSIPVIGALRLGRIGRVMRVLRLLRGVKVTRVLGTFFLSRRAESVLLASALLAVLLLLASSVGVLQVERGPEANIRTAGDAVWWSFATITTVAYGDRFPVTNGGKLIGAFLMTAGVGLFGALVGLMASWFLAPASRREASETETLRSEVAGLRAAVERLTALLRGR